MAYPLNAAAKAALDAGDLPLETTFTLFDETGMGYDLPAGLNDASEAQVLDASLEGSVVNSPNWHLSFSVQVDDALRALLLKYRKIVVNTVVRSADGTIAQIFPEFTGTIAENDAYEELQEDGTESKVYRLDAFGTLKASEEAYVNRSFNPAVKTPLTDYTQPNVPTWNLTSVLRNVTLTMPAKNSYAGNDEQILPVAVTYDNPSNLLVYVPKTNATVTSSTANASYPAVNAISGINTEWRSTEGPGAWLMLTWGAAVTIDSILLRQSPTVGSLNNATLTFSDGSTIALTPDSPLDGSPIIYSFPAKTTTSLKITAGAGSTSPVAILELWPMFKGAGVSLGTPYSFNLVTGNVRGHYPFQTTTNNSSQSNPAGPANWVINVTSALGAQAGDMVMFGTTYTVQWPVVSANPSSVPATITVAVPAGTGANVINLAPNSAVFSVYPPGGSVASEQRLKWIDSSVYPVRSYLVDVFLVDRWVINSGDTYQANPFLNNAKVLPADLTAEDMPGLPTGDSAYLNFYKRWDNRALMKVFYRLMDQGLGTVQTFPSSYFELRPDQGYLRWVGPPVHLNYATALAIWAAPYDPEAASSQAESLVSTLLQSDMGIGAGSLSLAATSVPIGPVVYKDKRAADILAQLKADGALPPGYYLHDERDGTVTGKFYIQKTTPDVVLRNVKGISARDQLPLATAVRIRATDPLARNLAAQALVWADPSIDFLDRWFDGKTSTTSNAGTGTSTYAAAFLIQQPIDKLKVNFKGRLLVGIEPDTSKLSSLFLPSYYAPYHHPRMSYIGLDQAGDKEETSWAPYEPGFPYLLLLGFRPGELSTFSGNANGTPVTAAIGEVEIWATPRVDRYAYLIDNSGAFPLPADAVPPKDATGTVLYGGVFADQGASSYGSSGNYWYSPKNKAFYRYAPPAVMQRVALNYSAGLHRLQPMDFPGISPVTAGSYAQQTLNEIVRRTAPVDVRCGWEPVDLGDTVLLTDGTLKIAMSLNKQLLGPRETTISGFDYGF